MSHSLYKTKVLTAYLWMFLSYMACFAQSPVDLSIHNTSLYLANNQSLTVQGDLLNLSDPSQSGNLCMAQGADLYLQGGLNHNATGAPLLAHGSEGRIHFNGPGGHDISGSGVHNYHQLEIDKSSTGSMELLSNISVEDSLVMSNGNLNLGNQVLDFSNKGKLVNERNYSRVMSYGNGYVSAIVKGIGFTNNQIERGLGLEMLGSSDSLYLRRYHNLIPNMPDSSILKNFEVRSLNPLDSGSTSVSFNYLDSELNGNMERNLVLHTSKDLTNWEYVGMGLLSPQSKTISMTMQYSNTPLRIAVAPLKPLEIDLGEDTTLCEGATISLEVPGDPTKYHFMWSTQDFSPSITVSEPGIYYVERFDNSLVYFDSDTIVVDTISSTLVQIGDSLYPAGGDAYSYYVCGLGFSFPGSVPLVVPAVPGSLAAIATRQGCQDTSDCLTYAPSGPCNLLDVVDRFPSPNSNSLPVDGSISAIFDFDIDPASVNSTSFVVYSNLRGYIPGGFTVLGDTVEFRPSTEFAAGELISVTLTDSLTSIQSCNLSKRITYQFHIKPSGGIASFGRRQDKSVSGNYDKIAVGDLNGDGAIDMVTGQMNAQNDTCWIFLNDGLGNLDATRIPLSTTGGVEEISIGDLDRDGDLDLYLNTFMGDSILLNDGNAAFTPYYSNQTNYFGVSHLADFNGDGFLDILMGSAGGQQKILLNNATVPLDFTLSHSFGSNPSGTNSIGDVDRDGDLDIASNEFGQGIVLATNNGDGTFNSSSPFGPTYLSSAIGGIETELADFNNDGLLDLVAKSTFNQNGTDSISVLLGDGNGGFIEILTHSVASTFSNITFGDLNGDNSQDLLVPHRSFPTTSTLKLENDGAAMFTASFFSNIYSLGQSALVDLDGDLDMDYITSYDFFGTNPWFFNGCAFPSLNLGDDLDFCPGGSAVLDASAGTGTFTYAWSTGASTPSILVNSYGTYFVEKTDSLGCSETDTIEVTQTQLNPVVVLSNGYLYDTSNVVGTREWIVCTSGASFGFQDSLAVPPTPFSVQVILSANGCIDTSACFSSNGPPLAVDDSLVLFESTVGIIDVQANDLDPDGDPLVTAIVQQPANGLLAVVNGDSLQYTPIPLFSGRDTFSYQVCDNGNPMACDTATVYINVLPGSSCRYATSELMLNCNDLPLSVNANPLICISLEATDSVPTGMIGLDYGIEYDPTVLLPTGNLNMGPVLLSGGNTPSFFFNYQNTPGEALVSFYYTNLQASLQGMGEVACLEFELLSGYNYGDVISVDVDSVTESSIFSYQTLCVDSNSIVVDQDTLLAGRILFMGNSSSVLGYDSLNPTAWNSTNISLVDSACQALNSDTLRPGLDGRFELVADPQSFISFERDVPGGSTTPCPVSVQPIINGMDRYLTGLVTTRDTSWIPSVHQIIAMDVNMDGRIFSNDLAIMASRSVMSICEYPQLWNIQGNEPGKDWLFIDPEELSQNPAYAISASYPQDDGIGYSSNRVPTPDFCMPIPSTQTGSCTGLDSLEIHGILLGDVNGNWDSVAVNNIRTSASGPIGIDLAAATVSNGCTLQVPLQWLNNQNFKSLDLHLQFDPLEFEVMDVKLNPAIQPNTSQLVWNQTAPGQILASAYATVAGGLSLNGVFGNIKIVPLNSTIDSLAWINPTAFVNGVQIPIQIDGVANCTTTASQPAGPSKINVYPNPFTNGLSIDYTQMDLPVESIELFDLVGKQLGSIQVEQGGVSQVDLTVLAKGQYFIKVNQQWTIPIRKL